MISGFLLWGSVLNLIIEDHGGNDFRLPHLRCR
jgi:hypothetical protein